MKYKWLFLDLDNTILDFNKSQKYALEKTIAQHGISENKKHNEIYTYINKKVWEDFEKGKISQTELRTLRMQKFLSHIGSDADVQQFSQDYLEHLGSVAFYLDNAESLVKNWSKQFKLALVTNGLREVQRARLTHTDLENYFEAVIISDEIGVAKPHRGFFDFAFEKINQPPKNEVLMIGDSLSSDIKGGNNYGIDTCWLNLSDRSAPAHNLPTFTIKKLEDLEKIIL